MSEASTSVQRAFETDGSFERIDGSTWDYTTTAFDGRVTVDRPTSSATEATSFTVTITLPTLSAVTDEHVADVVEDGWFETFELRVEDVSGVTKRSRDLDPSVRRSGSEIVVEVSLTDANTARGVADAAAFVDFVEGTYVQGIIPGYDYTEPVRSIRSKARQQGNGGA
ncbi:hypothetical protein SAMN05192561_11319 [Halopenitus malekzadehii]|uniref:Uncharacterized protein n=1 Tax=Halopenitus malekzadehii TaxID=1267564 RepID=A0A1H6JQT4_9EURY|nr:DUF5813 family protein [Halopenitus malekzadehii]SEH61568.1 hypothetical protein SAMN05192561_11319 [Halopenitus malekzadehii]